MGVGRRPRDAPQRDMLGNPELDGKVGNLTPEPLPPPVGLNP